MILLASYSIVNFISVTNIPYIVGYIYILAKMVSFTRYKIGIATEIDLTSAERTSLSETWSLLKIYIPFQMGFWESDRMTSWGRWSNTSNRQTIIVAHNLLAHELL